MRKLKLFFACLLMAVLSIGQMWGAETQFSWAGSSTADGGATDYVVTVSPITLTFAKGSNNNAPRTNKEGAVRMYTGTTLTISSSASNITRVVFTPTTNSYQATNLTYNSVALTGNDWTLETPAASVTLTATANARFKTIVVHTADGSDPVAVTGVTLDQSVAEVAVGKTITLVPTVAPTNATNKAVSWESSDDDVATVANGVVSGVAEGSATITVKTIDGNKTATCAVTVTPAPAADNYELVTNVANLAAGDKIIIVNADATKAISTTQNSNNRGAADVSATNDVITPGDAVQVLTLGKSGDNWTLYTGEGYLYASSGSSNQMKTQTTLNDNGKWAITISMNVATFVAQGSNSRNVMQYNGQNSIFACYASASQTDLKIFKKVDGTVKPSAELSYAAADQKKLTKLGETFTAPTLVNPHTVAVTYASSNTDIVEVNASTGAITAIKAAGVAVITASFAGNDDYKAGDASYTIGVTSHAGTEADPYVAADAKIVIDAVETKENAYVSGIVSSIYTTTLPQEGYISFYFSADGNTTGQQIEAYKCYGLDSAPFEALTDVKTGATVVVTGTLKKFNSTYELDQNCHLVSYEAPAAQKQSIANDQANPYTVAQALVYAADGVTYDLDDYVYVQGVVYDVKSFNNGAMNIFIKDANAENQFELFKCAGINDGNATTSFEALTDVQAGNIVIGYGQLSYFAPYYEFKQGNYLVDLQKPVTGIELDKTEASVEEEATVTLTATILPSNATGTIVWSVESGSDKASVENGVVTGIAEGEATIRATVQGTEIYAECTVTVTATTPALTNYYQKVTETAGIVEGTYLIVYEEGSLAFNGGLETLDAKNNVIDVEITNDNKIGVTTATEAATFYIEPAAGTIQAANGKYIGVTSNSNGLKQSDNADAYENAFEIDADGNAVISAVFENANMTMRYNKASDQNRFRYFGSSQQPIALYKLANEVVKASPELAWSDNVEITIDGDFTAPTLSHATGITGTINYQSDNEAVATVDANGAISLTVPHATGTAHITATYDGDENFKAGSAVCTIKVNPAHSIYVSPSLTVNFGSVAKDASVDDKVITITLTEVPNATATLGGDNPEVFSIDPASPAALTASGDITISASSATAGVFEAKLTISDDASLATSRVVTLKLTVTDPAAEETPISTTSKWVAATAADLVDGAEVIITGVKDEVVYAMGEQKSTNRAAYVASVDGEGVLTPGEGTMSFTLVAQAAEGVFALRTSDGKYLYAASNGSNHLKTQDVVNDSARWTLTATSAIAVKTGLRNVMQFNGGNTKLFSCYSSDSQEDIQFYVPKPVTPPTPVYTEVRSGLEAGRHYTVCLEKNVTAVKGATFWSLTYRNEGGTAAYLVEETAPFPAGKPYIFQATGDNDGKLEVVYGSDEVNEPVENGALRGTFGGLTTEQLNAINVGDAKVYMIFSNELCPIGTDNHLDAHRAYVRYDLLTVPSTSNFAPGKRVKSMPMQGQTTTGIDALNASETPVKMIIDGQLFIIRGEKMYNVNGQLVK